MERSAGGVQWADDGVGAVEGRAGRRDRADVIDVGVGKVRGDLDEHGHRRAHFIARLDGRLHELAELVALLERAEPWFRV